MSESVEKTGFEGVIEKLSGNLDSRELQVDLARKVLNEYSDRGLDFDMGNGALSKLQDWRGRCAHALRLIDRLEKTIK